MGNQDDTADPIPDGHVDLACPYCYHPAAYMGVGAPARYQCTVCGAVFEVIHPPMKDVQSKIPE